MESDNHHYLVRWVVASVSVIGLICVFVFQQFNFSSLVLPHGKPFSLFLINRTTRFFLNDGLAIALIWALFYKKQYVVFSLWVQLVGMCFILIPYFILKSYFPSYNGPLLSFLHRLILNPTLLLLLIPAFYYQMRTSKNSTAETRGRKGGAEDQ